MLSNKKKSLFARYKGLLITAFLLLILFGVPSSLYLIWCYSDLTPPDLSEMDLEEVKIPASKNGFSFIDKEFESVNFGTKGRSIIGTPFYLDKNFQIPKRYQHFDFDLSVKEARKVLDLNKEHYEDLENAIKFEFIQPPIPGEGLEYSIYILHITWLYNLKFWTQIEAGKINSCFSIAHHLIQLGSKIQAATTGTSTDLFSQEIIQSGLTKLRWLSMIPSSKVEQIESSIKKLQNLKSSTRGLKADLKFDFYFNRKQYITFKEHFDSGEAEDYHQNLLELPHSLLINDTLTNYLKMYREFLDIDGAPNYASFQDPLPPSRFYQKQVGPLKIDLKHRNSIGQRYLSSYYRDTLDHLYTGYRTDSTKNLTLLKLAMSLHVREKKSLPETLEELSPNYLTEIPTDPISGKKYSYSKNKKIIYSLGPDLNQTISDYFDSDLIEEDEHAKPPPLREAFLQNQYYYVYDIDPAVLLEFAPSITDSK